MAILKCFHVYILLFDPSNEKYNFADVNVPVVGGHAGVTILPLFSQVMLALHFLLVSGCH